MRKSSLMTTAYISSFANKTEFDLYSDKTAKNWANVIETHLKIIQNNGIVEPLSKEFTKPEFIELKTDNLREGLLSKGIISRQRASLLVLEELMNRLSLPSQSHLRIYSPEGLSVFASNLKRLFPKCRVSEYLEDPDDFRRSIVRHQDLSRLSLPPGSQHCILCNDVFEHVERLDLCLLELKEALIPGGYLIATFPFALNATKNIEKAIYRGPGEEPEYLCEPEWHEDPISPSGKSLVYRIPGWDILEEIRDIGFSDVRMNAIISSFYGILGSDFPGVFVMTARA